jgi:hypothetical protein
VTRGTRLRTSGILVIEGMCVCVCVCAYMVLFLYGPYCRSFVTQDILERTSGTLRP